MSDGIRRRDFLKIVAATGMAASCDMPQQPPENLFSPVVPPEGHIPGVAVWYATVCRECPAGCGAVVRVREGRALKAEGNPFHPINRGRLCAKGQASLQGLYNPDRIRQPLLRDTSGQLQPVSWEKAVISCGTFSSTTLKSSLTRFVMILFLLSVTINGTVTSSTKTRMGGAWSSRPAAPCAGRGCCADALVTEMANIETNHNIVRIRFAY